MLITQSLMVIPMPCVLLLLLCSFASRQGLVVDGFSVPSSNTPTIAAKARGPVLPTSHCITNTATRRTYLQVSAASSQESSNSDQGIPSQQAPPSSSFLSSVMGDGNSDENNNNQKGNGNNNNDDNNNPQQYDDSIRRGLRRLAQLSLEDYAWRMSLFKEKEADRQMEEYMARLMGEDASYVRPMDASENKIGPLGRAEKAAVDWLSQVIDEEGRRAKKIVNADGELVRPMMAGDGTGEELGPLGTLEAKVVEFLESIRTAEKLRVQEGGFWSSPRILDESDRGPLGELEMSVTSALRKIQESEILRMEQQKRRGGEVVRPIDVPGPLGEFELAVAEMIQTERLRARDGEKTEKGIVRPKDAAVKGKLGEYEDQAVEALSRLTEEERERLRSIQQKLRDNQPMAAEEPSLLGILESVLIGILRAPALLIGVVTRVTELLQSESLNQKDQALLVSRTTEKDKKKD